MDYPVMEIVASDGTDVPSNLKIFNTYEVSNILHVYITPDTFRDFSLYEMHELSSSGLVEVEIPGNIQMNRNWIDIQTTCLNLGIGQHSYRISLFNPTTHDVVYQYFSYIIQNDNPDKSYVYMDKCSNSCCKCCK